MAPFCHPKSSRKSIQTPLEGVPGHLGPLLAALTAPLGPLLPFMALLCRFGPLLNDFWLDFGFQFGGPGEPSFGPLLRVWDPLGSKTPQTAPRTSKTYHFGRFFVLSGPPKSQFLMIWEASRLTQNRYFFIILNKVFELVLGLSLWAAQGNLGTALGTVAGWPKATGYSDFDNC